LFQRVGRRVEQPSLRRRQPGSCFGSAKERSQRSPGTNGKEERAKSWMAAHRGEVDERGWAGVCEGGSGAGEGPCSIPVLPGLDASREGRWVSRGGELLLGAVEN